MPNERIDVLGVQFNNYTLSQYVELIERRIDSAIGTFIVTANPEIVMLAREDKGFSDLVARADLVTADGIGIIKAANMLDTPIVERVAGFDLLVKLLELANERGYKIFFIGASAEVINDLVKKVSRSYPNIKVSGYQDGYFKNSNIVITKIVDRQPQIVFAALGAKRQEFFLSELQSHLSSALLMGVGGSFDVLSGHSKRAPKWMQAAHIEWFYRLIKEPWRWRRMLVLPKFLKEVHEAQKARNF